MDSGKKDTPVKAISKGGTKSEGEPSQSLFTKLDLYLLHRPFVSTVATAMCLASVWLVTWLFVLFFITYFTVTSTVAKVFIAGLILSTTSEAIIRRAEMNPRWERYGRGVLHDDEIEVSAAWALAYLLGGLFLVAIIKDISTIPIEKNFSLTPLIDGEKIYGMFLRWRNLFYDSNVMMASLFWCWVLRVVIYKRPHKSRTWKLAAAHFDEPKVIDPTEELKEKINQLDEIKKKINQLTKSI